MNTSQSHTNYTFRQKMRAMNGMLFMLNRKRELTRLIAWTDRKLAKRRLKWAEGVRKAYGNQYDEIDNKLSLLQGRFPYQYRLALILHGISNLVSVKPRYYKSRSKNRQ